jgi:hypothetical protein
VEFVVLSTKISIYRWPVDRIQKWYNERPWYFGCNFIPSTAINQLEMWQKETFDLDTIDVELKLASSLGMNIVRVYLHDLLWFDDSNSFLERIEQFLSVAAKYEIMTMFVLFDNCHDPHPKLGRQREPREHKHNSGWVQSPHVEVLKNMSRHHVLEDYFKGIIKHFSDDNRVLCWDLYNEPGNPNRRAYPKYMPDNLDELAFNLCQKSVRWAREVNPSQPITIGIWRGSWDKDNSDELTQFCINNSDIISFHCYSSEQRFTEKVSFLMRFDRPLICTEYIARTNNNTFFNTLPFLRKYKIAACNWGLVSGKTQTQYPWDSNKKVYETEPEVWHHDIFRDNGEPYDVSEIEFIRKIIAG